jgi:hypothetical protein
MPHTLAELTFDDNQKSVEILRNPKKIAIVVDRQWIEHARQAAGRG